MSLNPWLTQAIKHQADPSWHLLLFRACETLPEEYCAFLTEHTWLPGKEKIFNAFSQPLDKTHYILYGESPYPREASANGFAFWDAAVGDVWSEQGLSKSVNRATSLRNFFKMLLATEPVLVPPKRIRTLAELFNNLHQQGFLLLNFNLSLSTLSKNREAKYWMPFHECLLMQIKYHCEQNKQVPPKLVLLGKIAEKILQLPSSDVYPCFCAEHPYNLSFIKNPEVKNFFQRFDLLRIR
jgi:uracil-DNA glycosylase